MSNLWDFIQALPNGDPPCDFGVIIKRCLAVIFRKDANHRLFVAFLIIPSVFGSSFWTISGFFRSSFCIVRYILVFGSSFWTVLGIFGSSVWAIPCVFINTYFSRLGKILMIKERINMF